MQYFSGASEICGLGDLLYETFGPELGEIISERSQAVLFHEVSSAVSLPLKFSVR
jgi:hypothetical protein